jgi:hypothetical protein
MKVSCTQCGAELTVLETDYYLRCPYCEASITVTAAEDLPFIVVPAAGEEAVRRMFPAGAISELELRFFPYLDGGGGLRPVFSQPFPELEDYVPPAGDRKVFAESLAGPDQIIPIDDDLLEDTGSGRGSTVLHPFYLVMLGMEGFSQGVLVDGVSGKVVGDNPLEGGTAPELPSRVFLRSALVGIPAAALVYALLASAGTGGGTLAFLTLLTAAGGSWAGMSLLGVREDSDG